MYSVYVTDLRLFYQLLKIMNSISVFHQML